MRARIYIPHEFLPEWWRFPTLYRDYLPELQMEVDSVMANPTEAASISRALQEMAGSQRFYQWTSEDHKHRVTACVD